jgi:hypothetical protein
MKSGDSPTVKEPSMFSEKRTRVPLQTILAALVLLLTSAGVVLSASACAGDSRPEAAAGGDTGSDASTGGQTGGEATPGSGTAPREISAEDFDPSLFDESSATIDNEWVPFEPGKRFVWEGWTEEEGERIDHRIVFTVTDMTKVINGVRTLVGWDRDFSAGKLIETELIFLAQDKDGNVWHFGQYRENYDEEGEFDGGRAWLVGHLTGAKAGIYMKAEPRLGAPAYSQGFAPPPYYWDDWGETYRVAEKTCSPDECWKDIVVIDEFEPTKPGAHQLKYYARGVGNVRVGWRGSDQEKEVMFLVKVVRLSPEAMAKVRATVREHEARAYVYGGTAPAEPRGADGP